jgi:hypothetical protein
MTRPAPLAALVAALLLAPTAGPAAEADFLGLAAPVPDAWEAEAPQSRMRVLQYGVPGDESGDARFVVYYFGQGYGGTVEDNVERWQSQFSGPEGGLVEPRISRFESNGMPITLVELEGTYARSVGMGPGEEAKRERTLLAAIIESPKGSLFAQLFGPTPAVDAARPGLEDFLAGIRVAEE